MSFEFQNKKITDHIYRITDGSDVCEYLIIGEDKALLVDTGYGVGDLKTYVESLTDLPVSVYLTHCHVDHAGGTYPFQNVHMSKKDKHLALKQLSLEFRKEVSSHSLGLLDENMYQPVDNRDFKDIVDEELVDLGNVHVLMIEIPGHTEGSIVPIIIEDKVAIFGDACGVGTLICLEGSTTVKEYLNSLKKLKRYESLYDRVLRQHGSYVSEKKILDENIENCELILNGKDDHVETVFMDRKCYWARKRDEHGNREDGKEGNICYSI